VLGFAFEQSRIPARPMRAPHENSTWIRKYTSLFLINPISTKKRTGQTIPMPSSPLTESDIIFPSASTSLTTALRSLKRSNLSITNRLHSIKSDADFVLSVANAFGFPLIANERCGSWYISPEQKAGNAYFKSTDGHHGQWGFSLRRLNLQVLDVVGRGDGYVMISMDFVGFHFWCSCYVTSCKTAETLVFDQVHHRRLHAPWQEYARCAEQDDTHLDYRAQSLALPELRRSLGAANALGRSIRLRTCSDGRENRLDGARSPKPWS